MRQVSSHKLWIGHALSIRDAGLLHRAGIRALVDVAGNERPLNMPRDFLYCRLPLSDGSGNSAAVLSEALNTVARLLREQVPVMVACAAGMSRSPAIAAGGLALATGKPAGECLSIVTTGAPSDVSQALWAAILEVMDEQGEDDGEE